MIFQSHNRLQAPITRLRFLPLIRVAHKFSKRNCLLPLKISGRECCYIIDSIHEFHHQRTKPNQAHASFWTGLIKLIKMIYNVYRSNLYKVGKFHSSICYFSGLRGVSLESYEQEWEDCFTRRFCHIQHKSRSGGSETRLTGTHGFKHLTSSQPHCSQPVKNDDNLCRKCTNIFLKRLKLNEHEFY